jgi:Tfp pilus assembly protein PilN
MINLLPPQVKQDTIYARRNTKLRNWTLAVALAVFGGIVIMALGYLYITQSTNTYAKQINEGQEKLKIQKLDETQAKVSQISSSVKLVIQVLSREILFSKVLKQVGAVIPAGAVLTDLTIGKIEGGIDLTFEAKDYQTGSQILLNLQDPNNKVFEKADIESIKCDSEVQPGRIYVCQVSIRALFGDNSPFLFINNKATP